MASSCICPHTLPNGTQLQSMKAGKQGNKQESKLASYPYSTGYNVQNQNFYKIDGIVHEA
jgi:hypothetical protein